MRVPCLVYTTPAKNLKSRIVDMYTFEHLWTQYFALNYGEDYIHTQETYDPLSLFFEVDHPGICNSISGSNVGTGCIHIHEG